MSILATIYFMILFAICRNGVENPILKFFITTFILYMGGSVVLSMYNPYGLYEVSLKTYLIVIIGVSCFTIGLRSFCPQVNKAKNNFYVSDYIDQLLNKKWFLATIIICDLFVIYLFQKQAVLMTMYSALELRADLDELLFAGNSVLGLGKNMVIDPLGTIITFLGSYLLIYRRDKFLPLALTLVYIFCDSMLGGSRGGFFKIFLYCVFMLSIKNYVRLSNVRKSSKSTILVLAAVGVVVFLIMCNMTAQRSYSATGFSLDNVLIGMDDMTKQFVTYSVGPFRLLDASFSGDYFDKLGGYKFGRCTFGFIDGMVSLVSGKLGISYAYANKEVLALLQDTWIDVGGSTMNFAYTSFFFFIQDLGLLGIIVFPLLFAYSIKFFITKFQKNQNPTVLILISYFYYVSLYMIFSWGLYRNISFMVMFYIWLMNKFLKNRFPRVQ